MRSFINSVIYFIITSEPPRQKHVFTRNERRNFKRCRDTRQRLYFYRMTITTRRLIFWGLVIIFFTITPLIIAYGLGYSFDWQKKTFIETGSFYFASSPTSGTIYINNKASGKTNKYIKRLLPREYEIVIKKDGYQPWEKRLKIESGIVTEARNILLVPQNPKIEIVQKDVAQNFSLSAFTLTKTEKQKIELASTTANTFFKNSPYQLVNDDIFYLKITDYILYKTDLGKIKKQQTSLEPLPVDSYKISVSPDEKSIAALGKTGRLFLLNADQRIFEEIAASNIKDVQFSPDNKKLFYYSETELVVLYLDKILIQPYKEKGQKETVTRFSEKINSAIWYPEDNEHIIFVVGDTVKLIELDDRGQRNIYDLVKMQKFAKGTWENPQTIYDAKKERLYFINNNTLYSLQIKTGQLW